MEKIELTHSAGPWAVGSLRTETTNGENPFTYTSCYIRDANGMAVADVMGIDKANATWTPIGHAVPNIHLIAAAPLLLSALIVAVESIDQSIKDQIAFCDEVPVEYPSWYPEAKAAIAKAINIQP